MASTYPGGLDSFDSIASDKKTSDVVGGRTHRDMHNDLGDAIEAVQAELGTDPAGSYSTVKARLDALVAYAAKTSAYTATVADHTLNVTSGTFTLDLPAASTCTGQSLRVKNSGTGVVTLDGNSSETVEGVATFPLGPGSHVEITSTGSAWILTGGVPDTGWRRVLRWISDSVTEGSKGAGWSVSGNGYVAVRRIGSTIFWYGSHDGLTSPSSGSDALVAPPTGFAAAGGFALALQGNAAVEIDGSLMGRSGNNAYTGAGVPSPWGATLTALAAATWPTSLPGSAITI